MSNGFNDGLCILGDLGEQLGLMTLSLGNMTWRLA